MSTTTYVRISDTELQQRIDDLDLTMIKVKIQDEEEGLGWDETLTNEVEKEYRRFLFLKAKYPENEVVPHKFIDQFWHQHILDTEKYASDCDHLFGTFLHHYPYFGMNGDMQDLLDAFEETKEIYRKEFNAEYLGEAPKCKAPKCRTACKPMKCR